MARLDPYRYPVRDAPKDSWTEYSKNCDPKPDRDDDNEPEEDGAIIKFLKWFTGT